MLSKAGKYKNLAIQIDSPYVLIVHGLFTAYLGSGVVEACILPADGLFPDYPEMSGVYHMYEKSIRRIVDMPLQRQQLDALLAEASSDANAGYRIDFYANPNATRPTPWLSNGELPYRFPTRQE